PRTVAEEYRPRVRYRPLALECSVFTTEAAENASNTEASAALALQEENDFAPGAAPASSDSVVRPLLSPDLLCATLHTPPLNVPFCSLPCLAEALVILILPLRASTLVPTGS